MTAAPKQADVLLRPQGPGVAEVVLNRPEKMNAITTDLARDLGRVLALAAEEADVVVLRGAGGNFSAGGDYEHLTAISGDREALRRLFESFHATCSLIGKLDLPVIAAVEGVAMAGGFELMQSCDIVLAAENAKIADNHSNFAMVPGGGGSQRLPRLVGAQRALGLILSGDRLSGAEAVRWGLAYRSCPDGEVAAEAAELARKLATKDRTALARSKRLIREGLERPLAEGLAAELDVVVDHIAGEGGEARLRGFQGEERDSVEGPGA